MNDELKGINFEDEEFNDVAGSQDTEEDIDVEPVRLSKKKVGTILIVFFGFIAIVISIIARISLSKKVDSSNKNNSVVNTVQSGEVNSASNYEEKESEITETEPYFEDMGSSSQEEVNSANSEDFVKEVDTATGSVVESSSNNVLIEGTIIESSNENPEPNSDFEMVLTEPALGSEISTQGIVTGMYMYKIGNSYTYGVNILIVTGNDANIECSYFCPRRTYSALQIGDALSVIYQMDSQGNISIASISK